MSVKQFFLATSAIAIMLPAIAMAQTNTTSAASADPKSPVTHAEFSDLLKETLLENPEMIVEAVKRIHDKQKAETEKEVEKSIEKYSDALFNDTTSPSIGDPKNTNITLIEFFDYHCGYCKRMLPTITQLHNEDPKVRIIFREFPILAEDSSDASLAALSVYKLYPDKYFSFHTALMGTNGQFDDKTLSAVAKKEGLDWSRIKKEMSNTEIETMLNKNHAIAEELGVRGTPALILGTQMLPGAVPYEDLKQMVEDARAGKKIDLSEPPVASHQKPGSPSGN